MTSATEPADMVYPPRHDHEEIARRRQRAVRTAKVIGIIAAVIYIGFILTGVFAQ